MRTVYLVRHGAPDIPGGGRMCLGRTDLPLNRLGRMQAVLTGGALAGAGLTNVYCSPLLRSRQTAEYLSPPAAVLPGLEEMDTGEWDGLYFEEILLRWPELYARRGEDFAACIPGGESRPEMLRRFSAALCRALASSSGNVAVVSHKTVIQTYLGEHLGLSPRGAQSIPLPYGSVTRLLFSDGRLSVADVGVPPHPVPDEILCARLLAAAGVPETVAAHSAAVAETARFLAGPLLEIGVPLSLERVLAGARLHDIARCECHHAAVGADWLAALGYPELAEIIRQHNDLDDPGRIDEAAVVFIADKLVEGARPTTLESRFAASREKCTSPSARTVHARRYAAAAAVAAGINRLCGKTLIP